MENTPIPFGKRIHPVESINVRFENRKFLLKIGRNQYAIPITKANWNPTKEVWWAEHQDVIFQWRFSPDEVKKRIGG
jgi:hypothetical protein